MVPVFLGETKVQVELDDEFEALVRQLHHDVENAHDALRQLQAADGEAYASVTTVIAARSVLYRQQKALPPRSRTSDTPSITALVNRSVSL